MANFALSLIPKVGKNATFIISHPFEATISVRNENLTLRNIGKRLEISHIENKYEYLTLFRPGFFTV